jgi:glucose uptake protein GlcU
MLQLSLLLDFPFINSCNLFFLGGGGVARSSLLSTRHFVVTTITNILILGESSHASERANNPEK